MTFSNRQARALNAKLAHRHVKTRVSNGASIAYVEGWHVIAEANRIFGFDSWDRTTVSPVCLWSELQRGQTVCFYSTRVRIRVRAGGSVIIRDGIGTGIGRATSSEQAHEIALKAAETDATKRALATFGNPFGLALYDKDRIGVSKPAPTPISNARTSKTPKSPGRAPLPRASGEPERSSEPLPEAPPAAYTLVLPGSRPSEPMRPQLFIAAALERIPKLATVEALYAFWEANLPTFAALRRTMTRKDDDPVGAIVVALKERARELGHKVKADSRQARPVANESRLETSDVAARLAIPKEKRLRDKSHLVFVASQPCTICGRQPSHAHHLRFAQPRAMAMKVSDEFTVPLCAVHHDEVHRTGDERAWWARRGKIEPLKIAARLWEASRLGTTDLASVSNQLPSAAGPDTESGSAEPSRQASRQAEGSSHGPMPNSGFSTNDGTGASPAAPSTAAE